MQITAQERIAIADFSDEKFPELCVDTCSEDAVAVYRFQTDKGWDIGIVECGKGPSVRFEYWWPQGGVGHEPTLEKAKAELLKEFF